MPWLALFASKNHMIHFYNSEENYVIAEFIALGFFGISSLQISWCLEWWLNSIMVNGIFFFEEK